MGSTFSKSIPIHVQCEGGSFDQGALNINLAVQTSTASEPPDLITSFGTPE